MQTDFTLNTANQENANGKLEHIKSWGLSEFSQKSLINNK